MKEKQEEKKQYLQYMVCPPESTDYFPAKRHLASYKSAQLLNSR